MSRRDLRSRVKAQEQARGTDSDELLMVVGSDQRPRVMMASELKSADSEYSQGVVCPDETCRLLLPGGATRTLESPSS